MWNSTWYGIKLLLAQAYQRSTPTRLPLEDGEGQQSPRLAPFQYSPLVAPIHIRVLDILPGNHNSEIRFRLREKELGDGDVYHALSYAWGPPDFTHKIYSAESFIQVTENLWEALRRYRKAGESITLWVDAVCIDQSNEQERSQQPTNPSVGVQICSPYDDTLRLKSRQAGHSKSLATRGRHSP